MVLVNISVCLRDLTNARKSRKQLINIDICINYYMN